MGQGGEKGTCSERLQHNKAELHLKNDLTKTEQAMLAEDQERCNFQFYLKTLLYFYSQKEILKGMKQVYQLNFNSRSLEIMHNVLVLPT